jgi:hypothetical protein
MTYDELIERLDPAVYQSLKQAIELGKWPDGRTISPQQRIICMEAVLHYEGLHNIPEQERVGYLDRKKSDGGACGPDDGTSPLRILN